MPPNRTSSLQYRYHHGGGGGGGGNESISTNATLAAAFNKYNPTNTLNTHHHQSHRFSSSVAQQQQNNDDRHSIYSSFSLRLSNLNSMSSYSLSTAAAAASQNGPAGVYAEAGYLPGPCLNDADKGKIESCYQSIGSSVHSAMCSAQLYTTCLESLIKLLDWRHLVTGVPVWVFNTGLNPKRPKGISNFMR